MEFILVNEFWKFESFVNFAAVYGFFSSYNAMRCGPAANVAQLRRRPTSLTRLKDDVKMGSC